MFRRYLLVLLVVCGLAAVFAGPALGDSPAPGWAVTGRFGPTNLAPGGVGILHLYVYNIGAGEVTGKNPVLVDELPEGLEAVSVIEGSPNPEKYRESLGCSGTKEVTCELGAIAPSSEPDRLNIPVRVSPTVPVGSKAEDLVSVSGGGALGVARGRVPVAFGSEPAGFGFANFDAWLSNADGTIDTQAGSHPYSLSVSFATDVGGTGAGQERPTVGEAHALNVNLPAGLVGEPGAVPQCTRFQFDNVECPPQSEIGTDYTSLAGAGILNFPVYNLVPPPGVAAQFAFAFSGTDVYLDSGVRSGGDNGITTHVDPLVQEGVTFNTTVIWGVPAEHTESPSELVAQPARPLLTLPTSCQGPQEFSIEALGTWQEPNAVAHENDPLEQARDSYVTRNEAGEEVGFTGCERLLHFQPSLEASPDTSDTDTPAGLTASVRVPQNVNPEGLATAGLKDTTVVLPAGVVINPGQATGLVACQPDQEALGLAENGEVNEGPPSCPAASKVGTDQIATPLLPDKLEGSVYVLQSNPPELKLLVAASADGVNLKLVGTVHLDEATGQLTTTFENTPDAPFTEFKLSFSGGAQAALVTPATCGLYSSSATFTPWSTPLVGEAFGSTSFDISAGTGGSACPGVLPFSPSLTAGATTDEAGGYTDFSLLLQRGDGQQRIDGLQFKAPAGLTGFISHVPLCTNAQAETNSCPAASKIGHSVVESGPGPYPLVIPEAGQEPAPIYLTEGYGGAPFGLSIVVPIHAGPFTLPTQRVRAKIEIDPLTSALTVTTDPLPQVVAGIPTDLREVDAVIEHPEFMVNPTNCNPQEFSGTAYGTPPPGVGGVNASAAISSHFQVGACQALKFQPKFSVSASGKNSKAGGASLTAKVTYPSVPQGTDADIGYVKIELPKQLPSRLTTLQKACKSEQFQANPAACPAESKIGYATVHTPLLPVALSGPVIFVSHGGEAFPSLTVVLQGDGVTIELIGTTFISKTGITSTTFKTVPDDPFSTFELTLPQGKYSALATNVPTSAHYSLCGQKLTMPNELIGQNGAAIKQSTPITITGCTKTKTRTLTRAQKRARALKACTHDKSKTKRAKCEQAARKKYGPAKKQKKSK